ncbi:Uncharacterised protein [Legionella pneumophila]|nr:Uncharacterised protein [Legionella pneumophila]CZH29559.1 Uncharacterised protein [Legionella pneumophila]CZH60525.1 Uncharacterised protein [Legionella pneumophila]CZH62415.1 Uncharacterised protein [Legionella pneumophila]CZI84960.1 Uncharacterised protein [Legionella pneumophila]
MIFIQNNRGIEIDFFLIFKDFADELVIFNVFPERLLTFLMIFRVEISLVYVIIAGTFIISSYHKKGLCDENFFQFLWSYIS